MKLYFAISDLPKGKDSKSARSKYIPKLKIDNASFKLSVITFCNLVFDYAEMGKNCRTDGSM